MGGAFYGSDMKGRSQSTEGRGLDHQDLQVKTQTEVSFVSAFLIFMSNLETLSYIFFIRS